MTHSCSLLLLLCDCSSFPPEPQILWVSICLSTLSFLSPHLKHLLSSSLLFNHQKLQQLVYSLPFHLNSKSWPLALELLFSNDLLSPQPHTSFLLLCNLLAEAAPFLKSPIKTANSPKVTLYSPSSSAQVPLLRYFIKPEFQSWALSILSTNQPLFHPICAHPA